MYTVLKFKWTPSQFANLGRKEKAFVIACINKQIEADKKAMDEAKRK